MVPSVANVDGDFAEFSLKDWMSCLAFHVICGLIEVSNSWDVAFLLLPEYVAVVVNHYCSVMKGFFDFLSLQNGSNDDHIVFPCQFAKHLRGFSVDWL